MKKVGVVLSGCGVKDGSEIHESVLTLLALTQAGACYQCLAPNIAQTQVINHYTGERMPEKRHVLVEAARIARGDILDLATANPAELDAAIFPGGFGAALNLCDFATQGEACTIEPHVLAFAKAMLAQKKPLGFICIAPAMIPKIVGAGASLTIGNDRETARKIEAMGGKHVSCAVTACVTDTNARIVSTPAYMLAKNIGEAFIGIEKLVRQVLDLIS